MKRLVILFLFFFVTFNLFSQIVNNGNFETHSSCPTTYGFINLATGWNRPTSSSTSPDYYNGCAPYLSNVSVPLRLCDTLTDFVSGNAAYVAFLSRDSVFGAWYEYITSRLSRPLYPGVNYHLQYLIANKRFANFNTNVGAVISYNPMVQSSRFPINYPAPSSHQPCYNSDTEITNTSWTWLMYNFKTDTCGLEYITFGRFLHDTVAIDTNPRPRPPICGGSERYSYYYIDEVSITGNEPNIDLPDTLSLCDSFRLTVDTAYFYAYQWYRNGIAIPGATQNYYVVYEAGTYFVQLTLPICHSIMFSDTTFVFNPHEIMHLDYRSTSCSKGFISVFFDSGITPSVEWSAPNAGDPFDSTYHYKPNFLRTDTINTVQLHIDYGYGCTFDTTLYIYPCCETSNSNGFDTLNVNRVSNLIAFYDVNHDGKITRSEFGFYDYNLDGILYIDTNVVFDSLEFKMQVDASIIINSNRKLTIQNSFLHACGSRMWRGILLTDSSKTLILKNNIIADAIEAIHTEHNGKIILRDNIFDLNYKSIVIQNHYTTYIDTISHNQFLCQKWPGYLTDSLLRAPYAGQRSYLGIAVNNVKSVNIGELGGTATRNKFDNLYNGIATFMSGGNIRNNEMISIINTTFDGKGISVKGDNSLNAYNLSMKIGYDLTNQNKLTWCTYGVELQGMAAEILYNDFNNNFQVIRFINTTSALLGGSKFNTRIHHNSIDTLKGIFTFDGVGINTDQIYNSIKLIDNNTITNPFFSSSLDLMTKSVGILSNNSLSAGSGNYEANNNTITNIRLGIKIYNGDSMHVHNNTISNAMTYPTLNKVGINLTNTVKSRVDCNTITMRFATGTQDMCIGLQASPNNRVRKNMLNNGNMAMRFNGDCTSNDQVWGNIMTNFNYYITRSTFGKIGKQSLAGPTSLLLPGNKFLPATTVPRLYSMNSSADTVQTFRYNTLSTYSAYATPATLSTRDSSTSRIISVITTLAASPYTWAETPGACGTLPYLIDGEDTSESDSSDMGMAMMIIESELTGTDAEITQNYEAKNYLYDDVNTDSAKYGWNTALSDFKAEYEESDAYSLKEAEKQLSMQDLVAANAILESTATPLAVMENMKTILNLQLDPTPLDSGTYKFDVVKAIAYSCPYSEGKAVYYARAMLISRFGYIDFDDDALCSSNGGDSHFRRANQNTSKEQNEIDIVPNPVLNSFVIKNNTDKELRSIDIFDMEGRHICTSKSVNIDMSKYSSGRYLARVKYTDNSETSKLFMKEE